MNGKGVIFEEYISEVREFECCASCHMDEEEGYSMCYIETDWGEGEVCCGAASAWSQMTPEEKDKVKQIWEKTQT